MTDIVSEEERFAAFLRSAVRQLDVPETPRDAMWAAIAARRQHRAPVESADWSTYVAPAVARDEMPVVHGAETRVVRSAGTSLTVETGGAPRGASTRSSFVRRGIPMRWAMPIAAGILAVGVGIGHGTWSGKSAASDTVAAVTPKIVSPEDQMRSVIDQHFAAVGTQLAQFSSNVDNGTGANTAASRAAVQESNEQIAAWADKMLTATQTLLDSKVPLDPKQRELLNDLESVLVQMQQLPGMPEDRDFIKQNIMHDQLVQRLKYASHQGTSQTI